MAEYKGIKGFKVQSLASDPSGPEGQVWYNTAGYVLKYQGTATSWSSGAVLGTALYNKGGGGGTLTAGITMSGKTGPGVPVIGSIIWLFPLYIRRASLPMDIREVVSVPFVRFLIVLFVNAKPVTTHFVRPRNIAPRICVHYQSQPYYLH